MLPLFPLEVVTAIFSFLIPSTAPPSYTTPSLRPADSNTMKAVLSFGLGLGLGVQGVMAGSHPLGGKCDIMNNRLDGFTKEFKSDCDGLGCE